VIRIGVTGHRGLAPGVRRAVAALLSAHLKPYGCEMVGLSCLADGADAVFAEAVVAAGAPLEAVVPASGYREALPEEHRPVYDRLLAQAVLVHALPHTESTPEAHMEAGRLLVRRCDQLVAVWDGRPARGPGGTADVVAYARSLFRPVSVLWPEGARR
jgi:predicted Rossmann fold nucleotide-binding protein DprA/Smf involved in DNA uptake